MGGLSHGDVGAGSQQCRQSHQGHFCYETLLDSSLELNSTLANFRMIGWGEGRTIFVRRKNYDMLKYEVEDSNKYL